MKPVLILICLLAVFGSSCKKKKNKEKEPDRIVMSVQPYFGENMVQLDSVYTTPEGYLIKFTDIKFYISGIRSGTSWTQDAALFDYRERGTQLLERLQGSFQPGGIVFKTGVNEENNHKDPSAFPNNHVLNILTANDMHWGWNPGYIFIKIEAKADTITDNVQVFDLPVNYHIGKDVNLREFSAENAVWKVVQENGQQKKYSLELKLDLEKLFYRPGFEIDLRTENKSHTDPGQELLSSKIADNFVYSLSVIP